MEAISSTQALAGRKKLVNPNSGAQRWRTPFMGVPIRVEEEVRDGPLAFLIEMTPDSVLPTHFHPVDQYQVFVSGSGLLGKHGAHGLAIHYADHHTAYGPITAGPHGVAYFTFRAKTDGRGMFLHKPGAREQLKPSPRRFRMVDGIVQAVPPVLAELPAPVTEQLLKEETDDGLASFMLRMGAGAAMRGPDPAGSSGQYYLVVSGSLLHAGAELPVWSVLWAGPAESAPTLTAGAAGAELLVLQFPGTRQTAKPRAAGSLRKWQCALCGFVYDEARGLPDEGIAPGTRWEDVPADWTCPDCSATKSDFEMMPVD